MPPRHHFPAPTAAEVEELDARCQAAFADEGMDEIEAHFAYGDYEIDEAYANGFKDALQSFILALRDSKTLDEALTTTLEAYGNNVT